ncbi:hypothetical protein H6G36_14565 [Anabaena minutissima FACHB-250]|nr:hypothetical protein [Anabaena minutissima FACHB-250]
MLQVSVDVCKKAICQPAIASNTARSAMANPPTVGVQIRWAVMRSLFSSQKMPQDK